MALVLASAACNFSILLACCSSERMILAALGGSTEKKLGISRGYMVAAATALLLSEPSACSSWITDLSTLFNVFYLFKSYHNQESEEYSA